MKALFALLVVLIAALIVWAVSDSPDDNALDLTKANSVPSKSASNSPQSNGIEEPEKENANLSDSSRTRVIGKRKPQGLTATWHPEKKGIFISPYNQEEIKAIGVVSGSKVTDSDGNELIVPAFDESPISIYPIGAPVPDRPSYVFNPFNQAVVDVRGIPKGTLVKDPNDPDKNHRFRTPGE